MPSAAIWLLTLTAFMVDGHSTITTHHGYPDEANCRAAGDITASQLTQTLIRSSWSCAKIDLESLSLSEAMAAYSPSHTGMVPYRQKSATAVVAAPPPKLFLSRISQPPHLRSRLSIRR